MCWSVGIWHYGARHITRLGAEVLDVISPRQGIKPSEKRKPDLETGTLGPNITDTHEKTSVLHSIKLDVILARRPKQSQDKSYLSDKGSQNALIQSGSVCNISWDILRSCVSLRMFGQRESQFRV